MITESFLLTIIVFLLIAAIWFFVEEIWDLALFARRSPQKEVKNLSTLRALSLFEHHDEIVAVDVRPYGSFKERRLPRALSAPYVDDSLDTANLDCLDPDKPILIYCDGGYRSRRAVGAFVDAGFKKVFHLNRGLMMWRLFGGPTETDSTPP
ncbi:rhodanese-like domain-containing protein [Verrucomicrobiales bacterium BCK34]|nr:rhodanese-like domain-containing protein [Verrucomicrobiales bacterium BCK34]